MSVYSIVRVGFQTHSNANNKVRLALTGTLKRGEPEAPFKWANTGLYIAEGADNAAVVDALARLMKALLKDAGTIDMVSITVSRSDGAVTEADPTDAELEAARADVEE